VKIISLTGSVLGENQQKDVIAQTKRPKGHYWQKNKKNNTY
jgi:hypothetical protein